MACKLPEDLVGPELGERLEQINRLLSRLAHDLRSPLHLVSGYADLLAMEQAGTLNARQRQYVELIRTGAHDAGRVIDQCQERLLALTQVGNEP